MKHFFLTTKCVCRHFKLRNKQRSPLRTLTCSDDFLFVSAFISRCLVRTATNLSAGQPYQAHRRHSQNCVAIAFSVTTRVREVSSAQIVPACTVLSHNGMPEHSGLLCGLRYRWTVTWNWGETTVGESFMFTHTIFAGRAADPRRLYPCCVCNGRVCTMCTYTCIIQMWCRVADVHSTIGVRHNVCKYPYTYTEVLSSAVIFFSAPSNDCKTVNQEPLHPLANVPRYRWLERTCDDPVASLCPWQSLKGELKNGDAHLFC